jgi:hypothetical protein
VRLEWINEAMDAAGSTPEHERDMAIMREWASAHPFGWPLEHEIPEVAAARKAIDRRRLEACWTAGRNYQAALEEWERRRIFAPHTEARRAS